MPVPCQSDGDHQQTGCEILQSENSVYVDMMVDSLKKKKNALTAIMAETREQETLLKSESMDADRFQEILDAKGEQVEELNRLDEGFSVLFQRMEKEISANRAMYQPQIEIMQGLIREVSELGLQIQALEKQNSEHFKVYLARQRKDIREYRVNYKTVSNYYQNMTNVHKPGQSYFFNEKK